MHSLPNDIARCEGEGCEIRETCLRFLAPRGEMQWYIAPDPETCEYHLPEDTFDDA